MNPLPFNETQQEDIDELYELVSGKEEDLHISKEILKLKQSEFSLSFDMREFICGIYKNDIELWQLLEIDRPYIPAYEELYDGEFI